MPSTQETQLWHLARFQVLSAAKSPHIARKIPSAYAFAWDSGVYPRYQTHPQMHIPFAQAFDVPPEKVDELNNLFAEVGETPEKIPSFYRLEMLFDVRGGRGFWTRIKLIDTCRYMYLSEMYNEDFWAAVLIGSDHPSEAKSIVRPFDVDRDIDF